ncbi:MAG TPA: hypothetical protein VER37_05915, partial [Thermomicrobiales bacterium]|nr:hypothetical protein [Thermomicrobiales bacterium]
MNANLETWYGYGPGPMEADAYADHLRVIHDPATVHTRCEDDRAGLGIDRAHDDADRAAGRRSAWTRTIGPLASPGSRASPVRRWFLADRLVSPRSPASTDSVTQVLTAATDRRDESTTEDWVTSPGRARAWFIRGYGRSEPLVGYLRAEAPGGRSLRRSAAPPEGGLSLAVAATTAIHRSLEERAINAIRGLAIDAIQAANSGHPGLPLGAAPMAFALWHGVLKHNPANPGWPDRDRFVLSGGHGSMLLYALLHLSGYDLSLDDLKNFRQLGSKTPGHPERGHTAGVEVTTGPLGQGFANGVGFAIAEAFLAATFNRPGHDIVDHFTYGIVTDGDIQEGIAAEAASLAGHLGLGKLVYLYDANQISLAGTVGLSMSEDVGRRFEAYGWHVLHVDGMDVESVRGAIEAAKAETARPSLIVARTIIGFGSPKANSFGVHGSPLGADAAAETKETLGLAAEPFALDAEAVAVWREAGEKGSAAEREWQGRMDAYAAAFPEEAAQLRA